MIASQAKKLQVDSRVEWSDGSQGTVIDTNWHALMIEWDDGVRCIYQFSNNEPQWKSMSIVPRAKVA